MQTEKKKVLVVVPVYKQSLSGREEASLRQAMKVLERYPMTLLVPEDLDTSMLQEQFPGVGFTRVSNEWLGCRGIAGYNRMMLSREFYEMFTDYEYILICQTDAWIFRDELEQRCDAGYDYVAAPWPKRKIYDRPLIRHYLKIRKFFFRSQKRIIRQQGFNKVGNGGLSLRRVDSFIAACHRHAEVIEIFKQHEGTLYNEDWFWSIIPRELNYPTLEVALGFSFDIRPQMCYELSGGKLPFGCHGWYKKRNIEFWGPIIEKKSSMKDKMFSLFGAFAPLLADIEDILFLEFIV